MPSESEGQRRLMAGCSKNPSKMKKCPPKKVADEFFAADKAKADARRRVGKPAAPARAKKGKK